MDRKHVVLLVLVCIAMFLGYLVNPFLAYDDTYAFMTQICGVSQVQGNLGSDLFFGLLPLFPCNFLFIKFVLLGLFIVSVLSISVLGETFCSEGGWKAGLFAATLSPLLFMESLKFENDIFGWTLVFGLCLIGLLVEL